MDYWNAYHCCHFSYIFNNTFISCPQNFASSNTGKIRNSILRNKISYKKQLLLIWLVDALSKRIITSGTNHNPGSWLGS